MKRKNLNVCKAIALSLILAGSMMTGCGNTDKQAKNDTTVSEEKDVTEDTNAEGSDAVSEEEDVENAEDSKDAADSEDVADNKNKTESSDKEDSSSTTASDKNNTSTAKADTKKTTTSNTAKKSTTTSGTASTTTTKKKNSTSSGSTSSKKNTTTSSSSSTKTEHKHNYNIPITKTTPVKEKGHYETKTTKEAVYAWRTFCGKCGKDLTNMSDDDLTIHVGDCNARYYTDYVEITPAETEKVWVVDTPASEKTETVGYKCSCGAVKK